MNGAHRLIPLDVVPGPIGGVPHACALSAAAGAEQLSRWRAFDREFGLGREEERERIVVRYAKTGESIERLVALVAAESFCCSFVEWSIDESEAELRLIVAGTPDALSLLSIR